jgi:glycerol-3-phosphate acyltransferase PlsY
MQFLISAIIGYMFGSIPTAYLFLKKSKGIDITTAGSGNVGAMNSFEITGSKKIGIAVFIIDFLKGLIPVIIILWIYGEVFALGTITLIFSLLSHCFNPWLMFKGGRGLSTAAGGSIILFPYLLFVWIVCWVLIYLFKKDILFANVFTNILTLIVVFLSYKIAINYTYPEPASIGELMFLTSAGLIIIFIKHIEPFKEIINNKLKK